MVDIKYLYICVPVIRSRRRQSCRCRVVSVSCRAARFVSDSTCASEHLLGSTFVLVRRLDAPTFL